jgi:hypothetical protein
MAENNDLLKCPLCEGHGELRRSKLIECLNDHELKAKIDAYLDEIMRPGNQADLASVSAPNEARDFQKDVHNWNPQLPMWRRSAKE